MVRRKKSKFRKLTLSKVEKKLLSEINDARKYDLWSLNIQKKAFFSIHDWQIKEKINAMSDKNYYELVLIGYQISLDRYNIRQIINIKKSEGEISGEYEDLYKESISRIDLMKNIISKFGMIDYHVIALYWEYTKPVEWRLPDTKKRFKEPPKKSHLGVYQLTGKRKFWNDN